MALSFVVLREATATVYDRDGNPYTELTDAPANLQFDKRPNVPELLIGRGQNLQNSHRLRLDLPESGLQPAIGDKAFVTTKRSPQLNGWWNVWDETRIDGSGRIPSMLVYLIREFK